MIDGKWKLIDSGRVERTKAMEVGSGVVMRLHVWEGKSDSVSLCFIPGGKLYAKGDEFVIGVK